MTTRLSDVATALPTRITGALLAFAVVAAVCSACGSGTAAQIGNDRVSVGALNRELTAIKANSAYVNAIAQRAGFPVTGAVDATGQHTAFLQAFVDKVLTDDIRYAALKQIADEHHLKITAAQLKPGPAVFGAASVVGGPAILQGFKSWYRSELIRRAATSYYLRQLLLANLTPRDWYAQHKADYVRACSYDIVTATRDQAFAARARIEAGESFQSVARQVSLDVGTGPQGGKLGCNERNLLVPELDRAAFSLPIGTVSQPIQVNANYHLLLVSSRPTPAYVYVAGEIKDALQAIGSARETSLLRERLAGSAINVDTRYGVWDRNSLTVVPARTIQPTPSPQFPVATFKPPTSSKQVDPYYAPGENIFITDSGFHPQELVAIAGLPITWKNETGTQATVRFVAGGQVIGPIPPGGTGSFTPDASIAIGYVLVGDTSVSGSIQVEPPS